MCSECVKSCTNEVHKIAGNVHTLDRSKCKACMKCIDNCKESNGGICSALSLPTKSISVKDLFLKIKPQLDLVKDIGGITLSGGEALLQYRAAKQLLSLCKKNGYDTAIETSGTLPLEIYKTVADKVDHWLFGLRPTKKCNTTFDLNRINTNLKFISSYSRNIIIRTPLINNYTTDEETISTIANIMQKYELNKIELLPYNLQSNHYYKAIGKRLINHENFSVTDNQTENIQSFLTKKNITSIIIN